MRYFSRWLVLGWLVILSTGLVGCGQGGGGGAKGRVALVDLQQVAQALGREGVLTAYDTGGAVRGQGPGAPMDQTAQPANASPQQAEQMRRELIRNFRAEVRPFARRVAQQQGMSIVVIKRDELILYNSRPNDITSQVIDQIQSATSGSGGGSTGGSGRSSGESSSSGGGG